MDARFKTFLIFKKRIGSFFRPQSVEKSKSEISPMLEVICCKGKYMLDSGRANYSFGGLHYVMQQVFAKYEIKDREIKNTLLLGFGAGSVASILQKEYKKKLKIVGVEKDPVVVDLAKKYFSLGKFKDLELYTEDAFDFVRNCNNKFDMIVMDVFVDVNVPDKFLEKEFISSLGDLLSVRGILFFNLVVYTERIRDKGNVLFNHMNELIGQTDWMRLNEHPTENWIFVTDKTKKPESSFLE